MNEIRVETANPYIVYTRSGAIDAIPHLVGEAAQVALLYPKVLEFSARQIARKLTSKVLLIEVPDGEHAKNPEVLATCWGRLATASFTRSDIVIGFGGGATTDLAGCVAGTFLRGISWIAVPTTVLGMVDAAVGGKTGIDIPEGKNLVGVFHEPLGVICDFDFLRGLPAREIHSGLAEVVKCGFIADAKILDLLEHQLHDSLDTDSDVFAELVERAVGLKARVVADDLTERTSSGSDVGREQLNYGHTFGHAVEIAQHFQLRHGEAISIGMIYAAQLAAIELGLSQDAVDLHRQLLRSIGLPTMFSSTPFAELRTTMGRDKKTRGNTLRFVLLPKLGTTRIVTPSEQSLEAAYALVSASPFASA
jgi:3-dehydroquinate synthase